MEIHIDRDLPVTLAEQIMGQIAYQIADGVLPPSSLLPSVRELASMLGVAPMTITRVYRDLSEKGLIISRAGIGTFVADVHDIGLPDDRDREKGLYEVANTYVRKALALGHSVNQVRATFLRCLEQYHVDRLPQRVAFVGNFRSATESYAREIERVLSDLNVSVLTLLLSDLEIDLEGVLSRLNGVKLIITIATRLQYVRRLLGPHGYRVVAIACPIKPETRNKIAAIPADSLVGCISTYPVFLSTMREGIVSYGLLQSPPICVLIEQEDRVKGMLDQVDVVIYATGSERVLEWLPSGVDAFEYLHAPDSNSVNRLRFLIS